MIVIHPEKRAALPSSTANVSTLSKMPLKNRVRVGSFALGLAGALVTSLLTWHSPEPALANYSDARNH